MAIKKEIDPLEEFRQQTRGLITANYRSFDDFCLNQAGIPKSTMSRILSGKRTGFRLHTLHKIAEGLGRKLTIRLD